MKIGVCTPLNVETISSRKNSFQQNVHISVIKMKRMDHMQADIFFSNIEKLLNRDISFTSTSTFIKLVYSEQVPRQPPRAQSEKTTGRLEIILRTIVIKKRARNIPQ